MPHAYLIHLASPLCSESGGQKKARHYTGASKVLRERFRDHFNGSGSRFLRAARRQGISFHVARAWQVATKDECFNLERALKRRHRAADFCPVCAAAAGREPSPTPKADPAEPFTVTEEMLHVGNTVRTILHRNIPQEEPPCSPRSAAPARSQTTAARSNGSALRSSITAPATRSAAPVPVSSPEPLPF